MVGHCADAGVWPDILGGLDHVEDGVGGKDDSHYSDRRAGTGHQRQSEEIAAHRYSCIAYCRNDGYEKPQNHLSDGEYLAAILHDK